MESVVGGGEGTDIAWVVSGSGGKSIFEMWTICGRVLMNCVQEDMKGMDDLGSRHFVT